MGSARYAGTGEPSGPLITTVSRTWLPRSTEGEHRPRAQVCARLGFAGTAASSSKARATTANSSSLTGSGRGPVKRGCATARAGARPRAIRRSVRGIMAVTLGSKAYVEGEHGGHTGHRTACALLETSDDRLRGVGAQDTGAVGQREGSCAPRQRAAAGQTAPGRRRGQLLGRGDGRYGQFGLGRALKRLHRKVGHGRRHSKGVWSLRRHARASARARRYAGQGEDGGAGGGATGDGSECDAGVRRLGVRGRAGS